MLVTTLTKKMSEDLTDYFADVGVRVRYLHSDIETLERIKILRDLRRVSDSSSLFGLSWLRPLINLCLSISAPARACRGYKATPGSGAMRPSSRSTAFAVARTNENPVAARPVRRDLFSI